MRFTAIFVAVATMVGVALAEPLGDRTYEAEL
jgi:hypothetical protein